jgi:hypothetical protein
MSKKSSIYRLEWKENIPNKIWGVGYMNLDSFLRDNKIISIYDDIIRKYEKTTFYKKMLNPYVDFEDFKWNDSGLYIFGFTSITSLKRCLGTRTYNHLIDLGFVLKQYNYYDECLFSKSNLQCIFTPLKKGKNVTDIINEPVYRIEHGLDNETNFDKNPYVNRGIYDSYIDLLHNDIISNMFKKHNTDTYPNFYEDFSNIILKETNTINHRKCENYFFGCDSLKDINRWFSKKEIETIKKFGFVIKEFVFYKEKHVGESKKQVIFIPTDIGSKIEI